MKVMEGRDSSDVTLGECVFVISPQGGGVGRRPCALYRPAA
ncbi:hypothetical protein [Candidatus Ichthyocystis sparus]